MMSQFTPVHRGHEKSGCFWSKISADFSANINHFLSEIGPLSETFKTMLRLIYMYSVSPSPPKGHGKGSQKRALSARGDML